MKTTIEDGTLRTSPHSGTPLGSIYGSESNGGSRNLEKYHTEVGGSRLDLKEKLPLPESGGLESKDQHADTLPSWKSLLKPGEVVVIKGMRFTYTGHGKRCIHLRRIP